MKKRKEKKKKRVAIFKTLWNYKQNSIEETIQRQNQVKSVSTNGHPWS